MVCEIVCQEHDKLIRGLEKAACEDYLISKRTKVRTVKVYCHTCIYDGQKGIGKRVSINGEEDDNKYPLSLLRKLINGDIRELPNPL
jgi:hypothetical protein